MSLIQLLLKKRFGPMFWTQFLGSLNDNFLKNAFVILVTFKAVTVFGIPSAKMVAIAGGIFILPYFLFSATAGQLADKYDKAMIIRTVKAAEIVIMLVAGFGLVTHRYELLLITLFMMGTHSAFFGPVKYSILPQHLADDELLSGNALIEAGTFLGILLGTIIGGVLVMRGEHGPLIAGVGLMGVAILGYLTSRGIPPAVPLDTGLQVQWNLVAPTIRIIRESMRNRPVFRTILVISWFWFFGAVILSLLPTFCRDFLHSDERTVTLFLASFSVGIGLGSLLCGLLAKTRLKGADVKAGAVGMSVFTADIFLAGAVEGRILFDLTMLAVSGGLFIVPLYTHMQNASEKSHRSRVIAANNILNAVFMVGSAVFVVAMFKLELTIPQIFLTLAALNVAVALAV